MYIERSIDKYLSEWKDGANRKPLLLRGARQVGKSSAIRHLGESFPYFIEVNFEKRKDINSIFESVHDVHNVADKIGILYNTPIVPGKTLLFLDEIQASLEAFYA